MIGNGLTDPYAQFGSVPEYVILIWFFKDVC